MCLGRLCAQGVILEPNFKYIDFGEAELSMPCQVGDFADYGGFYFIFKKFWHHYLNGIFKDFEM